MFYDENTIKSMYEDEIWLRYLLKYYLKDNPKSGYLAFQVLQWSPTEGTKIPIANAKITISKLLDNNYYVSKVLMTDSDGKTQPIALPTVPADFFLEPGSGNPYATYNAIIEAPKFLTAELSDLHVFEDINTFQTIKLLPMDE